MARAEEYAYRFPGLPNIFATIRPSTHSLSTKTGESYTLRASHARLGDNSRVVTSLNFEELFEVEWMGVSPCTRGISWPRGNTSCRQPRTEWSRDGRTSPEATRRVECAESDSLEVSVGTDRGTNGSKPFSPKGLAERVGFSLAFFVTYGKGKSLR